MLSFGILKIRKPVKWEMKYFVLTCRDDLVQIRYGNPGSRIQMSLLRLLSEEASQQFTYYCSGSVGWYDQANQGFENALTLLGENDFEFDYHEKKWIEVLHDGCSVSMLCWLNQIFGCKTFFTLFILCNFCDLLLIKPGFF